MPRDAAGLAEALRLPVAGHHDLVGECRLRGEPAARGTFVLRVQFELPGAVERKLRPRRLVRRGLRDGDAQERDPDQGRVHDNLQQPATNHSSWQLNGRILRQFDVLDVTTQVLHSEFERLLLTGSRIAE